MDKYAVVCGIKVYKKVRMAHTKRNWNVVIQSQTVKIQFTEKLTDIIFSFFEIRNLKKSKFVS